MNRQKQYQRLSDAEKQVQPLPGEIPAEHSYPVLMHVVARLGAQYRLGELVVPFTGEK